MLLRQFLKFQKEKDIPYDFRCRLCCEFKFNSMCCNECDAVYCEECQTSMKEKNKKCLKCKKDLGLKEIKGFFKDAMVSILCTCEFCSKEIYAEKFDKHKKKCYRRHLDCLIHTRKRLFVIPKELTEHQKRFLCGACKLLVIHPVKCKHCDQLYCEVCANQFFYENKQCICNEAGIIQVIPIGEFDNQGIAKVQLQCPHPNCKDVEFTYYQGQQHFYKCQDVTTYCSWPCKWSGPRRDYIIRNKAKTERYQKEVEELNETLSKCQLKKDKLMRKSQKLARAYINLDERWFPKEQNVPEQKKDEKESISKEVEKITEERKQDDEPKPIVVEIQDD